MIADSDHIVILYPMWLGSMPALLKAFLEQVSLERNILKFCGIKPVRDSLVRIVESPHPAGRRRWLRRMERLGRAAA